MTIRKTGGYIMGQEKLAPEEQRVVEEKVSQAVEQVACKYRQAQEAAERYLLTRPAKVKRVTRLGNASGAPCRRTGLLHHDHAMSIKHRLASRQAGLARFMVFGLSIVLPLTTLAQQDTNKGLLEGAKDLAGTLKVEGKSITSGGDLKGCTLEFESVVLDHHYRRGDPSLVAGSITLQLVTKGNVTEVGVGLKTVVKDVVPKTGAVGLDFRDARPFFAFLETPAGQSNVKGFVTKMNSDTPGGLFSIFRMDDTFVPIFEAISKGAVVVAFTREKGKADVRVPLDLRVESSDGPQGRVRSDTPVNRFMGCVGPLLDKVR